MVKKVSSPKQLENVDIVLFDIQDVGARLHLYFYSTLCYGSCQEMMFRL